MITKAERRLNKLFTNLEIPNTGKILDISCGNGYLLNLIKQHHFSIEAYGIDISDNEIYAAKQKYQDINFYNGIAENLPFDDKIFDIVICSMSLHHYQNPLKIIEQVSRVAKSNAKIYFLDIFPNNFFINGLANIIKCRKPYHFEKFYSLNNFEKLLKTTSLKIDSVKNFQTLPPIKLTTLVNK